MKAEHRKELQTNALADRLGHLARDVKAGKGLSWLVIGGVVLVAILTIVFVWQTVLSNNVTKRSNAWVMLDQATTKGDLAEFEKVSEENSGTKMALAARYQRARILLQEGMDRLGGHQEIKDGEFTGPRQDAAQKVEVARDLYLELAGLSDTSGLLRQEAHLEAARAEEALIGVPKQKDPTRTQFRGSLDRAIELYEKAAKVAPKSFQTEAAEKRAQYLSVNRETVERFYTQLDIELTRKKFDSGALHP